MGVFRDFFEGIVGDIFRNVCAILFMQLIDSQIYGVQIGYLIFYLPILLLLANKY